MEQTILEAALRYASYGWRVFPLCRPRDNGFCTHTKKCDAKGKAPILVPHGCLDATTDEDQIKEWFTGRDDLNLGIATGPESNLVVVDVDNMASLNLIPSLGQVATVQTGRGGCHAFYTYPKDCEVQSKNGRLVGQDGKIIPGIDIKAKGGYVVAVPSLHQSGNYYTWVIAPHDCDPQPCPQWVLTGLSTAPVKGAAKKQAVSITDTKVTEGSRDEFLFNQACKMRGFGLDAEAIYAALVVINNKCCVPPVEDEQVKKCAESGAKYDVQERHVLKSGEILLESDDVSYVASVYRKNSPVEYRWHNRDSWTFYHNNHWEKVQPNQAENISNYIRRFLSRCKLKKVDPKTHSVTYEALPATMLGQMYVANVLQWVRSQVCLTDSQGAPCSLDGTLDPRNTIAMRNGLLDIRDPKKPVLHPHTPSFYTLNYLPFDYNPEATCPHWHQRLGEYFTNDKGEPDKLVPPILHTWMRNIVLNRTELQKIYCIAGPTRSGKSTIAEVIRQLVGPMNTASPNLAHMAGNFGLQSLLNKQLAILSDVNINTRRVDTARVVEVLKTISGEDVVTVARKNQEDLHVKLPLIFLMITNQMTDLKDPSGALACRFQFLQTTRSFEGHENPHVMKELLSELPGIFNEVLMASEVQATHPNSRDMSEEFRMLSSPYNAFVRDWCVLDKDVFIPKDVLWVYYQAWCDRRGYPRVGNDSFKIGFMHSQQGLVSIRPVISDQNKTFLEDKYKLRHSVNEMGLESQNMPPAVDWARHRVQCWQGIDIAPEFLTPLNVWRCREDLARVS